MAYGSGMYQLNPVTPETLCGYVVKHTSECSAILDAGCGRGDCLKWLSANTKMDLYGSECDPENFKLAKTACPNAEIRLERVEEPSWNEASFDSVLMGCVLSLSDMAEEAVKNMRRVLRDNGTLILSDMYARGESGVINSTILRYIRKKVEMEQLIQSAGFTFVGFEDYTDALTEMAIRLVMEGNGCDSFGTVSERRKIKMGYGIWIFAAV